MGTLKMGEVEEINKQVIKTACLMSMKAHKSPEKHYLSKKINKSSFIFSFPGSWSVNDWFANHSFGEKKVDLQLFPSFKYIGLDEIATCNEAFLKIFKAVLANQHFKNEIEKAVTRRKRVVFAGHSSGGAIAILATIWFLELYVRQGCKDTAPLCVTFGSPLVGDRIMSHALRREKWSRYFLNFVTRCDIVPRISLTPLSAIEKQLQQVLDFFNPKSKSYKQEPADEVPGFFVTVMENASSVASYAACNIMGSPNLLLETLSSFIKLSPYTPLGTYVFCIDNRKLVVESNPDAILQVLFYSSQLSTVEEKVTVARGSLSDHLNYTDGLRKILQMKILSCFDHGHLEALVLSLDDANEIVTVDTASVGLGLVSSASFAPHMISPQNVGLLNLSGHIGSNSELESTKFAEIGHISFNHHDWLMPTACTDVFRLVSQSDRTRLCISAAKELEKQKLRNQAAIDEKKREIEEKIQKLEAYKSNCELSKGCYYDVFKISKDEEDFHANLERLELAGIWDEIIEMLKRYKLPDEFECQKAWIDLGTRYRRVVEPLDIANYYRHLKNEDTGPYMGKGRPKRYKCAQRWLEHAKKMPNEFPESCFWAEVEELCIKSRSPGIKESITLLRNKVEKWIQDGELGEDVRFENSTFKKLLDEHSLPI